VLHHDWSWVIVGGVLSMLGGLAFIAATDSGYAAAAELDR